LLPLPNGMKDVRTTGYSVKDQCLQLHLLRFIPEVPNTEIY
jgi:hypothetical protein